MIAALLAEVQQRRRQLDVLSGQVAQLAEQISATEAEVAKYRALSEREARAAALLTTIGELAQETARDKVQQLATRALQAIFGPEHEFILKPGERAGQATLELRVRTTLPGHPVVETGVLDARGGGLAQVVAFVLRLVVLLLTPDVANVLWMDEPFGMVSTSYEARVAEFLREVAHKAKVQLMLVTHSPVYADYADEAVRLELNSAGVTVVHRGESE